MQSLRFMTAAGDLRAELIAEGVLRPGTVIDSCGLTRTRTPATVRLDAIGRAAARRADRSTASWEIARLVERGMAR